MRIETSSKLPFANRTFYATCPVCDGNERKKKNCEVCFGLGIVELEFICPRECGEGFMTFDELQLHVLIAHGISLVQEKEVRTTSDVI